MSDSESASGTNVGLVVLAFIGGLILGGGITAAGGYMLFARTAAAEREAAERAEAVALRDGMRALQGVKEAVQKATPPMFDMTKVSDKAAAETVGREFLTDWRENRITKAYRHTSAAFQMKTDRKAFDELVKKYSLASAFPESTDKSTPPKAAADGKSYKYFCTIKIGVSGWLDFAMTLKEEEGEWKIDELVIEKNE